MSLEDQIDCGVGYNGIIAFIQVSSPKRSRQVNFGSNLLWVKFALDLRVHLGAVVDSCDL